MLEFSTAAATTVDAADNALIYESISDDAASAALRLAAWAIS